MFTVYHSNQLDLLKSLTAQLIKRQPLDSIFEREIILVQSQGMGQWLQIQLADELNISANIHYPFPTQFIWDIYRIFYPDLPKENVFNVDLMTWVLLDILPKLVIHPQFEVLNHYFNYSDDEQKRYQLANCIAQLFDQYLVYRADWLKVWEKGERVKELDYDIQEWQAALWKELVLSIKNLSFPFSNRIDIHIAVIEALKDPNIALTLIKKLPTRVFIFGIVSLPPLYLDFFHALSRHIDIHFMFMNPCRQYWGDIVDRSFLSKHIRPDQELDSIIKDTNPLLASWGKLGRDHLALLQNYNDKQDIDVFADYAQETLLSRVQQSILDMQNDPIEQVTLANLLTSTCKQKIAADDNSITFHVCHSEQREVEVLYDNLLAILDHYSDIELNDCVVMVADIDHYAPYIQSVFDNAPKSRYLPYTISDQKLKHIDPIVQGFLLLLDLPQSRIGLEYIFDLLEIPTVAKRFLINEEDLVQLRHWIVDSGVRWGLTSHLDEPHSWLTGLHRMLLGYTMYSELDSWKSIFPYDETTGLNAELVGHLCDFISTITKWFDILNQHHFIEEWQSLCVQLLTDFFVFEADSESLLLMIEEQWQRIMQQATLADYHEKVSVTILKNLLQSTFDNNYLSHRFLIGKINFCTMMPMRSVPFKVVCLLGMNDGVYPRSISPLGVDLINRHGRIGDRSRRNDDRYLFLEAFLSAEQKFYVSYIGYDIQTNDDRYPSILVDELLDYVSQHYVLQCDELLPIEVSTKALKHYLVRHHPRTPFNIQNYVSDEVNLSRHVVSYADEWLAAAKYQGEKNAFDTKLTSQTSLSVSIEDLKQFYAHPIKELARKRLGYFIGYSDEQLPENENFNLNGLQRYYLNNQMVDLFMDKDLTEKDLNNKLYQKLLRSNQLPYGAFGHIVYKEQKELMDVLVNKVNSERKGCFTSLDINYDIDGVVLTGRVKNVQNDGILQWRSAKLTIKDGMSLWIDHLAFCLVQPSGHDFHNRLYGRDSTQWHFKPLTSRQAHGLLSELINGYLDGIVKPLFLPLQSSWNWLEIAYEEGKQNITDDLIALSKAKSEFISRWQGGLYHNAECDDYYFRFYPELTDKLILDAIIALKVYLLPVIKYRCKED